MHTFRNPGLITGFLRNLGDGKPGPSFLILCCTRVRCSCFRHAVERGPADMSIWMSW
jgi:hypothetical protein